MCYHYYNMYNVATYMVFGYGSLTAARWLDEINLIAVIVLELNRWA